MDAQAKIQELEKRIEELEKLIDRHGEWIAGFVSEKRPRIRAREIELTDENDVVRIKLGVPKHELSGNYYPEIIMFDATGKETMKIDERTDGTGIIASSLGIVDKNGKVRISLTSANCGSIRYEDDRPVEGEGSIVLQDKDENTIFILQEGINGRPELSMFGGYWAKELMNRD